jgi:hypothetical protein
MGEVLLQSELVLRSLETVAEATDGDQKTGLIGLLFNLFAQAADMDIHSAGSDEVLLTPDFAE